MEPITNHKGSLCQHRFMICQEGFCAECNIHSEALKPYHEKPVVARTIKLSAPVFAVAR